ncbi:hypothetical protein Tsubulata_041168 [Turnera subulata]|uniref:FAS1 domain-containing protein n=1 Tax=Turnera subulata TaxID=218843 RepID=A0A9Q0F846_9ROSI|nr:hypothetical protein Tsubulata_041168 [Turnera subulata]
MSGFVGVIVSDPWLQSQFTQVELRTLKSKFVSVRTQAGRVKVGDLPSTFAKLRAFADTFSENDIRAMLKESHSDMEEEVDFENFLRHNINESEKASYVNHINTYLGEDPFLKKYLPLDAATNAVSDLVKDGVLLCKLINVAVPGTIDERAINTKAVLNPWERNENQTLCLNSCKAIGCTVVNIGAVDLVEARPHLVLGLISQIVKIQLLADLDLKKTPELVELVDDSKDVEELMGLAPEKVLLKWMNFHLKKAGYSKQVTNFSSDVKDGEAYAYLLSALAPEHSSPSTLTVEDPKARANLILEQAEKIEGGVLTHWSSSFLQEFGEYSQEVQGSTIEKTMEFSMFFMFSSTLLFLFTSPASAQTASPPAPTPTPAPAPAPGPAYVNLTDLLSVAGPFHTFLNYIDSTKVIDTFQNQANNTDEGITLFVPKDDAFSKLKKPSLSSLTQDQLKQVLLFHALPHYCSLAEFKNVSQVGPVSTFAGAGQFALNFTDVSGTVHINSGWSKTKISSSVHSTDPVAVYQVDKVLLPEAIFGTDIPPTPAPAPAPDVSPAADAPKAADDGESGHAPVTSPWNSSHRINFGIWSQLVLAFSAVMVLFL